MKTRGREMNQLAQYPDGDDQKQPGENVRIPLKHGIFCSRAKPSCVIDRVCWRWPRSMDFLSDRMEGGRPKRMDAHAFLVTVWCLRVPRLDPTLGQATLF